MIPLQRFLDPFLFLGILLLIVYKYSGIWLNDNPLDQNWRDLVFSVNEIAAIGGILSLIIGIIRPIVRAMLEGQFLAAALFYGAFWFVLSLPVLYLGVTGGDTVTGRLYWFSLLLLFLLTNFLIGMCFLIACFLPKKK